MPQNKIDKFDMRKVIIDSADQLKKGLELAKNVRAEGSFKNVIICGIGGSALPANLLDIATRPSVPVYIHRDYNLPSQANENSLVICISYSGNTEEAISGLKEALIKNLKIIGITSGGQVEEICKKNNIPLVKIDSGIQPRCATGYIFSALLKVLANSGITKDISEEIIKTSEKLKEINPSLEKHGEKLAKKLSKKIPVIYASGKFKSVARIWKIEFNENSKTPAFYNYFPEINHNEMVGFSQLKKNNNFHFIIIKDESDNPRNLKRMNLFASLLKKKGAKTDFIKTEQGSLLFKTFAVLLLGDWVSYYLALKYKIDPTPVKMVEEFKKLMKN